jgi:KaiC/GvpD/RAD55 family RecA-like ATPase
MLARMKSASAQKDPVHVHQHAVQFYGNDDALFTTVAGFVSEGLVAGQPAVVIATKSHADSILEHLTGRFIDVERAKHIGDLIVLDADNTLATFMKADEPDPTCFKRHVGDVIAQALGGRVRTPVRAYGEMVDVLWKQQKPEAAIKLEILWNELATTHAFSLLCGYSMGNFYKQTQQYDAVCAQHTRVIKSHENVVPFERRRVARTA